VIDGVVVALFYLDVVWWLRGMLCNAVDYCWTLYF